MKIRLSNKTFYNVIVMMISFGVFIGMMFPCFIVLTGVPAPFVMTLKFFIYCIIAGILVAIMNIAIVKKIIVQRICAMSHRMQQVETTLNISCIKKGYEYNPDAFLLKEDSDDTLGESVKSFNRLIASLSNALKFESDIRCFTEVLSKQLEIHTLSREALHLILDYLSAQGGLLLYKEDGCLLLGASSGILGGEDISKNSTILRITEEGKRQLVECKGHESCLEGFEFEHTPKNIVAQPILYEEVPMGFLLLSKDIPFTEEDLNKLDIFGMSLSIALSNALSHKKLQELASKDPLTGLYNRRFGVTRLNEEYSRSIRGEQPLGVIMLDIDHFKSVNDSHGHLIGDQALIHIASLLNETIREGDVVVRYGGEEFLCILPGANKDMTYRIAERVREKIMEHPFETDNLCIGMTISGGVSSHPEILSNSPEILIHEADKALYKAKRLGRNTIMC